MASPYDGLRDKEFTTNSGKDVKDTSMISGQAKDGLSGKNSTTQYETTGSMNSQGPLGGMASGK